MLRFVGFDGLEDLWSNGFRMGPISESLDWRNLVVE